MTPAWLECDDSPWIADEDRMVDETDEGDGEVVVGEVAGGEVVKAEDCDGEVVKAEDCDGDGDVVDGSTDSEVGVARVEEDMTDPKLVGRTVGRLNDDGAGEDEPP
jgi:hypothetical protein